MSFFWLDPKEIKNQVQPEGFFAAQATIVLPIFGQSCRADREGISGKALATTHPTTLRWYALSAASGKEGGGNFLISKSFNPTNHGSNKMR